MEDIGVMIVVEEESSMARNGKGRGAGRAWTLSTGSSEA